MRLWFILLLITPNVLLQTAVCVWYCTCSAFHFLPLNPLLWIRSVSCTCTPKGISAPPALSTWANSCYQSLFLIMKIISNRLCVNFESLRVTPPRHVTLISGRLCFAYRNNYSSVQFPHPASIQNQDRCLRLTQPGSPSSKPSGGR